MLPKKLTTRKEVNEKVDAILGPFEPVGVEGDWFGYILFGVSIALAYLFFWMVS